jgi:hypothetical protein
MVKESVRDWRSLREESQARAARHPLEKTASPHQVHDSELSIRVHYDERSERCSLEKAVRCLGN